LRPILRRAAGGRRRGARPAAEPTPATRGQGRIRGAGDKTLRDASSRATKAFYPALSMCDLIFSGVFERHPASPSPSWNSSWRGRLTCSRRWTTRTASATARRFTASRACPRESGGPALAKAGGRHAPERLLPPQRRAELPGGRHRHSPTPTLPSPASGGGKGGGSTT
jgi:hypothetical protein